MRYALALIVTAGCAKSIVGGCASDADCEPGVVCDLQTNRCGEGPGACEGAEAGDDDPQCGEIDCDGLDTACHDYADVLEGRCAADGACKPANDPATFVATVDRCAPYACAEAGGTPACRTSCADATTDCAPESICYFGRCCPEGWRIFAADTEGDVGFDAKVAVGGDGRAYGAWFVWGGGGVRVMANDAASPGTWTLLTTFPNARDSSDGYHALSLGVDASGTIHTLYFEDRALVYARDDGSGWTATSSGADTFDSAVMAVAPGGLAHVVHRHFSTVEYRFYAPDGATGACAPPLGVFTITAAEDGRAHLFGFNGSELRYAAQSQGCDPEDPTVADCCRFTGVDTDVGGGSPGSIAYDQAAGLAHITYYSTATGDLRHVACDTVSCTGEAIASPGAFGSDSSIAVGAGALHVAYYDATNRDLAYATNARGTWESSIVDADGNVGGYASLARGPDGRLHAVYYDGDARDAKYATLAPDCVPGE